MAWYDTKGKENDVVVSSRIRFARNLADYPFESKLDKTSAREIIEKISGALGGGYSKIDFSDISPVEAAALMEKHYVSHEFALKELPHALFLKEEQHLAVMACEEDHIRLQCIMPGLALEEAYKNAVGCDEQLDAELNIAFDEKLGYLTHCPTNLGTGMRASVMVFLPALTMTRSIESLSVQLAKLGLIIRGMYGEGSEPDGCLYQISNRVTMGITEEETIKKLSEVISQIALRERKARDIIKSDSYLKMSDRIFRSYGILKYARLMSSGEFMKLYSDVRLGIALGMIKDLSYEKLGEIMIGILPANLVMSAGGKQLDGSERDTLRADYVRKQLDK